MRNSILFSFARNSYQNENKTSNLKKSYLSSEERVSDFLFDKSVRFKVVYMYLRSVCVEPVYDCPLGKCSLLIF